MSEQAFPGAPVSEILSPEAQAVIRENQIAESTERANQLAIIRESDPTSLPDFVAWAEAHIEWRERREQLLNDNGTSDSLPGKHHAKTARNAIKVAWRLGINQTPPLPTGNTPITFDELEQIFDSLRKAAIFEIEKRAKSVAPTADAPGHEPAPVVESLDPLPIIAGRAGTKPELIWLKMYLDTNRGASTRDIETAAKALGHKLPKSSVNRILRREMWIGHPPRQQARRTTSTDPDVMDSSLSDDE